LAYNAQKKGLAIPKKRESLLPVSSLTEEEKALFERFSFPFPLPSVVSLAKVWVHRVEI